MTKETKTIVLTAEQLKNEGGKLNDLLPRIELMQQLCNACLLADRGNIGIELSHHQMKEALNVIFDYSQQLYHDVDKAAFKLLACDDKDELRTY